MAQVWLCSPSQFHAAQIKACADAGKHIFCEKPLATDLIETIDAVNYARKKGVKLMTALQRRFDPNFLRIKQARLPPPHATQNADVSRTHAFRLLTSFAPLSQGIDSGEIGEVITVKLCSRDPSPPPIEYVKGGGGIFKDMAVHDLDMARFLMGSEPVEILAQGSCNIDKSIEVLPGPEAFDTAMCLIKFANGKDAIIDVCRQAPYGYDQRAEVLGTKAMIQTDNTYPNTAKIFSATYTGNADMPYDFFMSRYKEAYVQVSIHHATCGLLAHYLPMTVYDSLPTADY